MSTDASPDLARMRPASDQQLTGQIESAIRANRLVTIGELTIRYCTRGQEFTEADQHFRALTAGVFLRLQVFEGGTVDFAQPTRITWGYYASLADLDLVLKGPLAKLDPRSRAELSADLAFSAALASFRSDAAERRRRSSLSYQVEFDHAPTL